MHSIQLYRIALAGVSFTTLVFSFPFFLIVWLIAMFKHLVNQKIYSAADKAVFDLVESCASA
jgi:hypothetical protein